MFLSSGLTTALQFTGPEQINADDDLSDGVLCSGVPFSRFVKKGGHLSPNFGKMISGNIFDHKEDTLRIILSPISGL